VIIISQIHDISMAKAEQADKVFEDSQDLRRKSLSIYRESGQGFCEIKALLESASKNNPVETDMGLFTSFSDYQVKTGLNRMKVNRYMYLAENWHIVERVKLLETKACFRLMISLKIIKWALEKLEVDPLWEGVAEDYFKKQEAVSKSKKQERDHQLAFYQEKVREQEFIISSLTSELASVTARLEEYRAIGLTYITE
jgi:hypothetical protein